eukprot:12963566-Alexandrium_andersonii.AAC.1
MQISQRIWSAFDYAPTLPFQMPTLSLPKHALYPSSLNSAVSDRASQQTPVEPELKSFDCGQGARTRIE